MGTEEDKEKEPPRLQLEMQADGLRITWGPQKGRWGVFSKDAEPVPVEIFEWHLSASETPPGHAAKPKEIKIEPVGAKTETKIPKDKLPKKGVVTVQLIGVFKSKDLKGEVFDEGIYAEPVSVEIS